MRLKLLSVLASVGLALSSAQPALAQAKAEPVKFAFCTDLTKFLTFVQPQFSQAALDYAKILNQQGGIEGHPVEVLVQDHGSEPQRAIECYEKMRREGAIAYYFASTAVTIAMLPRLMNDGSVMHSTFIGRGDSIDGEVFKWVFPVGPTYWGQAANHVHYIKTRSNGNLKGVKVAFIYPDYPFGQDSIPLLKTLAAHEGFELGLFPHPLPGNDQAAAWTQIRRFNPDWVISWNLSNMHVVASREMKRNGIPMDKYISTNWINEVDIANIGAENAKGLKRTTTVVGGKDHPLMQQIVKDLYDKGNGSGPAKHLDDIYYNGGLASMAPFFEGARLAIKEYGWPLTPDKMRRGMERMRNFDANGLMAPLTVTEKDHGGGGKSRIDMWDGAKWVPQTDWVSAYQDVVWATVKQRSAEFAKSRQ